MTHAFRKRTFTFPTSRAPARRAHQGKVVPLSFINGDPDGAGGSLSRATTASLRKGASADGALSTHTNAVSTFKTASSNARIIQLLSVDNEPDTPLVPITRDEGTGSMVRLRLVDSFRQGRRAANKDDDDGEESAEKSSLASEDLPEDPNSFPQAMKLSVYLGKMFFVMPTDLHGERFSWFYPQTILSLLVFGGLLMLTLLWVVRRIRFTDGSGFIGLMVVVFFGMTAAISFIFIRLANKRWGGMVRAFKRVEAQYGCVPHLRRKLNIIAVVLLITALVEHLMSRAGGLISLRKTYPNATFAEYFEIYYDWTFRDNVLSFIPYSLPVALIGYYVNIAATFMWNYNDLFIILVSLCLSDRYRMLRNKLMTDLKSRKPAREGYWRDARRAFNTLHRLTLHIDDDLSVHLMLSFLNNLYFICMQLLVGFKPHATDVVQTVYILFSFALLVGRTMAVCLVAASVHDESRMFKDVLYSVPTEDYDQEVYRFTVHATAEHISLTGCNMFSVTRSLLLTVAGTILTYEIVLVQLH